ncbi:ECF RNA polymerase sigma factor SigK [Glaciihabitans sp. dw_435]|uniref:ECF RNA polymerase sigma factor SigK n=1 Tax=Glaciihabitans sp. dw_435 TaxID=2720081 RepID=UPI001BD3A8F0|nr:ECF RNA polymerase sigma factor SigK [Glaciihabitans sp. dw_435]
MGGSSVESPRVRGDSDLLVRVASGSEDAFARLYEHAAAHVFGVVRRCLIDVAQSEEVTQEVFLEVWQCASRFDPSRGQAIAWILTIAHRRAIDRVRASQASRTRDVRTGIRDFAILHDHVSESVEISLEHVRVERAMAKLTALQREAIDLAYLDGYTQAEIAARLGVPIATVKTRLRDGLLRLRKELEAAA